MGRPGVRFAIECSPGVRAPRNLVGFGSGTRGPLFRVSWAAATLDATSAALQARCATGACSASGLQVDVTCPGAVKLPEPPCAAAPNRFPPCVAHDSDGGPPILRGRSCHDPGARAGAPPRSAATGRTSPVYMRSRPRGTAVGAAGARSSCRTRMFAVSRRLAATLKMPSGWPTGFGTASGVPESTSPARCQKH